MKKWNTSRSDKLKVDSRGREKQGQTRNKKGQKKKETDEGLDVKNKIIKSRGNCKKEETIEIYVEGRLGWSGEDKP